MQGRYGAWRKTLDKRERHAATCQLINALDEGGTIVGKTYRKELTRDNKARKALKRARRNIVAAELLREAHDWQTEVLSFDKYEVQ